MFVNMQELYLWQRYLAKKRRQIPEFPRISSCNILDLWFDYERYTERIQKLMKGNVAMCSQQKSCRTYIIIKITCRSMPSCVDIFLTSYSYVCFKWINTFADITRTLPINRHSSCNVPLIFNLSRIMYNLEALVFLIWFNVGLRTAMRHVLSPCTVKVNCVCNQYILYINTRIMQHKKVSLYTKPVQKFILNLPNRIFTNY
jgi:hypothetical protein